MAAGEEMGWWGGQEPYLWQRWQGHACGSMDASSDVATALSWQAPCCKS